jgi:hypothetical protein
MNSVSVIYCDDIRREEGGKTSLMGVYNSDFLVPQLPITIPQLCIQVHIRLDIQTQPSEIAVRITLGSEQIVEAKIDKVELNSIFNEVKMDPDARFVLIGYVFVHNQLPIEAQTRFDVFALIDGEEIRGNGLRVLLNQSTPPVARSTSKTNPVSGEKDVTAPPARQRRTPPKTAKTPKQ